MCDAVRITAPNARAPSSPTLPRIIAEVAVENIRQICQNIAKYPSNFPKFQPKFSTWRREQAVLADPELADPGADCDPRGGLQRLVREVAAVASNHEGAIADHIRRERGEDGLEEIGEEPRLLEGLGRGAQA
eukprot:COSAG04_NODE_564_length_12565_cov_220.319028_7_plen_132_part_00